MNLIDQYFTIMLFVQIAHSIEELSTGFHKKWYLKKIPFWLFLVLEIILECFLIAVLLLPGFPYRLYLQAFFLVLMFANGIQHIIWAGVAKKYVPGLITAPIIVIVFLIFYFQAVI